MKESAENKIN